MRVAYTTPCRSRPRLSAASRRTLSSSPPSLIASSSARANARGHARKLVFAEQVCRSSLGRLPTNDGEEASHFRSTVAYPRVQSPGCGKARCAVAAVPGRDPVDHNAPRTMSRCYGDESRSRLSRYSRYGALMRAIGRGGGVLLKADRVLCNGLNVTVHSPSTPSRRYCADYERYTTDLHCTSIFVDGQTMVVTC